MLTVEDFGRIRRAHRDGMAIRALARPWRAFRGLAPGGEELRRVPPRPRPLRPALRLRALHLRALRLPALRLPALRWRKLHGMAARRPIPWWPARPRLSSPRMRARLRASPPQPPPARARGKTPAGLAALPARADAAGHPYPAPGVAATLAPRTAPAAHCAAQAGHRPLPAHPRAKPRPVLSVPRPPWMPAEAAAGPCCLFPYAQTPWRRVAMRPPALQRSTREVTFQPK